MSWHPIFELDSDQLPAALSEEEEVLAGFQPGSSFWIMTRELDDGGGFVAVSSSHDGISGRGATCEAAQNDLLQQLNELYPPLRSVQ